MRKRRRKSGQTLAILPKVRVLKLYPSRLCCVEQWRSSGVTVGSSILPWLPYCSWWKPIGNRSGIRVPTVVTHSLLIACICFCSVFALACSPSDDSRPYKISANVSLVVLPVTATDRGQQFVSGLDTTQFRVYEEGRLQSLSLFQPEDVTWSRIWNQSSPAARPASMMP
jgi:hypothetical protein